MRLGGLYPILVIQISSYKVVYSYIANYARPRSKGKTRVVLKFHEISQNTKFHENSRNFKTDFSLLALTALHSDFASSLRYLSITEHILVLVDTLDCFSHRISFIVTRTIVANFTSIVNML